MGSLHRRYAGPRSAEERERRHAMLSSYARFQTAAQALGLALSPEELAQRAGAVVAFGLDGSTRVETLSREVFPNLSGSLCEALTMPASLEPAERSGALAIARVRESREEYSADGAGVHVDAERSALMGDVARLARILVELADRELRQAVGRTRDLRELELLRALGEDAREIAVRWEAMAEDRGLEQLDGPDRPQLAG